MSEIDDFLEKARSEGTLESEGSFSIDAERARRLLEQYQFFDPNWYLLKLVQAAVACGASETNIVFRSDCVQVTFLGENMLMIETKAVMEMMLQREQFDQGALKQLAIGLNGALVKSPERVEWSVWNPYFQEVLTLNREGSSLAKLQKRPHCIEDVGARSFYQLSLFPEPKISTDPKAEVSKTWFQKMASWLQTNKTPQTKQIAENHHDLAVKCRFAPIIVRIDGRRVNQPEELRKFAPSEDQIGFETSILEVGHNSIAISRYDPSPKRPHLQVHLENAGDYLVLSKRPNWTKGLLSAHLIFPTPPDSTPAVGKLFLVHYGVTLEEVPYQSPYPSMDLVLSSVGLNVDLSEQAVIKNELLEQRLADVSRLVLLILAQAPPPPRPKKPLSDGVFSTEPSPYIKHHAEYRASLPTQYQTDLCRPSVPFFAPVPVSMVPKDPLLDIGATSSGRLIRLGRLDNGNVRLDLPEPGVGHLNSPANVWPQNPPDSPTGWLAWIEGAIHCVAHNDFYKFSSDNLPGPYVEIASPDQPAVLAEFWPDGQLRTLCYQSSGTRLGWILTLEKRGLFGKVTHASDQFEEFYQAGCVYSNSLKPRPEIWYSWVKGWIEAVYRDALS